MPRNLRERERTPRSVDTGSSWDRRTSIEKQHQSSSIRVAPFDLSVAIQASDRDEAEGKASAAGVLVSRPDCARWTSLGKSVLTKERGVGVTAK